MARTKRYEHADQRYLSEIGKYELLDAEREKELGRRSTEGDLSTRNELVEHNLRLVVSIASRYRGNGLDMDDLIQSGNLGLMVAAEKYDPERGFRFTTFAVHWICQYIRREISDTGRTIRLPVYMTEKIHAMKKTERELEQELGRIPTIEELSMKLCVPQEKIALLQCMQAAPDSIDRMIGEDEDCSLAEIFPFETAKSAEDIVMRKLEKKEMQDLIGKCLNERETFVVTKRFGLDGEEKQTLTEVSESLRLSRERVRQIELTALRKMKRGARRLAG